VADASAGGDLALTPTERRLFEALRGQPGRAFTRAELVAIVMPDAVVLERTIDVHVKSLRRKLGPAAGQIRTLRGVGYCYQPS
jgi:two-component system, OmpR family, phosphate regulon response regulator PhoB